VFPVRAKSGERTLKNEGELGGNNTDLQRGRTVETGEKKLRKTTAFFLEKELTLRRKKKWRPNQKKHLERASFGGMGRAQSHEREPAD